MSDTPPPRLLPPVPVQLSGEVLELVTEWLPANDVLDRPQIQLATVDADQQPDIRTVLLSSWTPDGFSFHTDSASRKASHLAASPRAAFAVVWPGFSRQLTVQGIAEVADPEQIAETFRRRSPYLQQLAWQNSLDFAQLERDERVAGWSAFQADRRGTALEPSPTWTGYLVRPTRLTFWTSDAETASHRLEYTLSDGQWTLHHLPG